MLFSSLIFVFAFLPIVLAVNALLPKLAWKNVFLVIASLLFYAVGEGFNVLLIIGSIAINYMLGMVIADSSRETEPGRRKRLVVTGIGVAINLLILGYFKYLGFFAENINMVGKWFAWTPIDIPSITIPLAISFLTFHAISYLVDIYRGVGHAQRNPTKLALYFSLFPHLIAGPIVRYNHIEAQLDKRAVTVEKFAGGVERFIFGLAKKVLIANSVAMASDQIFAIPISHLSPSVAWYGVLCYAIQIYFDFSGYSDMAIGMAAMLGFDFPENFNYPYLATSMTDFWRRWHMTLSMWFRDYLYIPLGGNKRGHARTYFNLLLVFFLCGLWHGAMWTFVVWGLFHGIFLILERVLGRDRPEGAIAAQILRRVYVTVVILVSWVLFRSGSIGEAAGFIRTMFGFGGHASVLSAYSVAQPLSMWAMLAGVILSTRAVPAAVERIQRSSGSLPSTAYAIGYVAVSFTLLTLAMIRLTGSSYNPFIYFRF